MHWIFILWKKQIIFYFLLQNTKPLKAVATINGPNSVYGNVTFAQIGCNEAVLVEVYIFGLSDGEHGFHIHEKGDLTNGCTSTGSHYNPDKVCICSSKKKLNFQCFNAIIF